MKVCFVTGIDTDIGKTVAVGAMARYLLCQGRRVITVKMVQTGNDGFSEDLLKHREMMGIGMLPEDREGLTAPQVFRFPASPHLAARLEGREVDLDAIRRGVATLAERYDHVLVEGAGGLAVPLTEEVLTSDFVAEQQWPLVLVTSGRLGSLNHTIQALEMAAVRRLAIVGTVYNWSRWGGGSAGAGAGAVITADSRRLIAKYLARYGHRTAIVDLPEIGSDAPGVDFSSFFGDNHEF